MAIIEEIHARHEWLESLKPGDTVIEEGPGWPTRYYIKAVTRVTKTQVVVGDSRYRKTDGRKIGKVSSFGRTWRIAQPTREALDRARREDLVSALIGLRKSNLEDVPTEQLERAAEALGRKP